jgi:hypothetical protein
MQTATAAAAAAKMQTATAAAGGVLRAVQKRTSAAVVRALMTHQEMSHQVVWMSHLRGQRMSCSCMGVVAQRGDQGGLGVGQ